MKRSYQHIPPQVVAYIKYLHQDQKVRGRDIVKRFPLYSKSNIYAIMKQPIEMKKAPDGRTRNRGRPRKLTARDQRKIIRLVPQLRREGARRIQIEAGIDPNISLRTIRRCLNEHGYKYLQSRKKGLMSQTDVTKRLKFARRVKSTLPKTFWTEGVGFYLDGTSFVHKTNPKDQAKTAKTMAWRKPNEGLCLNCTSKGKKAGSGGRMAHFIVAIAYQKGVICCEQYQDRFTGVYFANFIRTHFESIFEKSANPRGKLFLQDGDPRQNSVPAKQAMNEVGARLFAIPPRSPDLNPIENFFHLVALKLHDDALQQNITKETYEEFSSRVKATMENYPVSDIDKIIASMDRRMSEIIRLKGGRLKY